MEATVWYRRAAEAGSRTAMLDLAHCLRKGIGTATNLFESAQWYLKAAEAGELSAAYPLAVCYENGDGVRRDRNAATKWFEVFASRFNECTDSSEKANLYGAQCWAVAFDYRTGYNIPKDVAEAIKWYRKAADAGDASAMYDLGLIFEKGDGVPQNYTHAYAWYCLCAAKGWASAATARDLLANLMTPSQIADSQREASAYAERKDTDPQTVPGGRKSGTRVTGAIGTGFFVSPDGFLLTAAHVVKNAKSITLETKQGTVSARVVQVDTANDAALLKAEGRFLCLAVTPSRNVKLGADVFTVGFPNIDIQGAAPKLTKGSINALSGIQDDPRAFQISVPVQPGNSGGPLLDATGNVIGVVVSQLDAVKTALITGSLPQGVNYAVKSAYVQPLLDAIPETSALPSPVKPRSFEDAVRAAETAVCIVLTYE
jgi:S1-C subfamily serine protease